MKNNRALFCLVIVLISVGLIVSCGKTQKPDAPKPDPREEFVRSLKGANVEGFNFATNEDKTRDVTSLTSGAVGQRITINKKSNGVVLRYTGVKDKSANTTKTYKTEIAKSGNIFELLVTDIGTAEVTFRLAFPQDDDGNNPPTPTTDCGSTESCADFECKKLPPIQCDVNKTCEPQRVGTVCCHNGGLISQHFLVVPNTPRCLLRDLVPNLEGGVVFEP